ncbi:MAG: ABC transporter permease subunit [Bacillota bacterium]
MGANEFKKFIHHLVLIILVILFIFPVYYSFVISTINYKEVFNEVPKLLPGNQLFNNYYKSWFDVNMGKMLITSILFSTATIVGKIILAILTSFAISHFDFKGKNLVFFLTLITLMIPVPVRIISTYQLIASFGWINTYKGLIIPLIASATGTFMLRQTFKSVPRELAEATMIDGGGPLTYLWRVLLPVSKTTISALFVILFIWSWNQYLWPLIVVSNANLRVIQLGIESAIPKGELPRWNLIMPIVIIAMLPPLIVILSLQKSLVNGLIETEK